MQNTTRPNSALLSAGILALLLLGCLAPPASGNPATNNSTLEGTHPDDASVATFASGCFWCVEAIYESLNGVYEAVSGYAGGPEQNPTYEQVSRGATGHAEAVQVFYDSSVVSFAQLVDVFFASQDATQVNGQGPDHGAQYRSIIFFATDEEKLAATQAKSALQASGTLEGPVAAEILQLERFWLAEDYHQDFERRNPNQRYIRAVSVPRFERFQAKRPDLLKASAQH